MEPPTPSAVPARPVALVITKTGPSATASQVLNPYDGMVFTGTDTFVAADTRAFVAQLVERGLVTDEPQPHVSAADRPDHSAGQSGN